MIEASAVLDFWFSAPGTGAFGNARAEWFRKSEAFDEEIRQRFSVAVERALDGDYVLWEADRRGALALILLLDQFPRNLYRNQALAFAGDARARAVARRVIEAAWDADMNMVERVFIYLPFEHSEDLVDQETAVTLFRGLASSGAAAEGFHDYARKHREIIARFGRFPHRNAALGRVSTPEESAYLASPGAGF